MCVAKHSFMCCYDDVTYQALFCEPYRGVHLCEISIKPSSFMRVLLILRGAHEIAPLSWSFVSRQKDKKKIIKAQLINIALQNKN